MSFPKVDEQINRLSELLVRIAGLALFAMIIFVCYGVVMRYVLKSPVAWANEAARFSFLVVIAFGLAYALRQGAHVATEFFVNILSARAKRRLYLFSMALFLIYAVIACWAGWQITSTAFVKGLRSDEAEIPLVIIRAFIPIGFFGLILQAIVEIRKLFFGGPGDGRESKTAHPEVGASTK